MAPDDVREDDDEQHDSAEHPSELPMDDAGDADRMAESG